MKFADKYEILEMVTSGRVSTFLARERTTQQPVVVYTFECAGTSAGELNTASIIAKFASLAPSPPGVIVKAGFDEASSSAFITTKMPETAALQDWVRSYHAFGRPAAPTPVVKPMSGPASDETAELSAAELRAYFAAQKEPKSAEPGWGTAEFAIDGSPQGGEFTRLFRELNAFQPVRSAEGSSPKAPTATDSDLSQRLGGARLGAQEPAPVQPTPVAPPASSPGAFTREFLGLSSTPSEVAPSSTGSHVPAREEPGAFTKEFLGIASQGPDTQTVKPRDVPAPVSNPAPSIFGNAFGSVPQQPPSAPTGFEPAPPAQKETTGEFTRFFRDPFETPGTPQTSPGVPELADVAPAKEQAGDFTRVFGPGGREPEPLTPVPAQNSAEAPGSFTQIFADSPVGKGSQLGGTALGTSPNLKAPQEPAVKASPEPSRPVSQASPPPIVDPFFGPPAPPRVPPPVDQGFLNRPVSSTTDVFRPGEAPPMEQVPSGPSEFTVFLNRSQLKAVLPPDVALPSGNPAGSPMSAPPPMPNPFAPPPLPPVPAVSKPVIPAPPPVPKPAAPAVPSMPTSSWPLITVLTVLLAIGALLIMYFVLKH